MAGLSVWWNLRKLRSSKPEVRAQVIPKLAASGNVSAVAPLCDLLQDEQRAIRTASAQALGTLKHSQAVGALVTALLSEKHWDVRYEIVDALRKIGDPTAVNELLVILDSRDTDVGLQQVTTWALKEFGWEHLTAAQQATVLIRREEWSALPRLGVAAVVPLLGAIKSGTHRMQMDACEALAQVTDERASKALLELLEADDDNLRRTAAAALEKRAWARLSHEQSATVTVVLEKWTAVPSFGESALPALARVLRRGDAATRCRALDALAQIGISQAAQMMSEALGDKDAGVRRTAARLLGRFGGEAMAERLLEAVSDEDPSVRQAAAISLDDLGYRPDGLHERVRLALAAERTADFVEMGVEAVGALIANLAQPTIRGLATEMLTRLGAGALPKVIEALGNASPTMRLAAAEVLEEMGDRSAHAALQKALEDVELTVRHAAHDALIKTGWQPRNEQQAAEVAVALEQWDAAEAFGPAALPALLPRIDDKVDAAQALRLIERILIGERAGEVAAPHLEVLAGLASGGPAGLTRGASGDLKSTVARRRVAQTARRELQRRNLPV